jgi:hypothetical protein
MIPTKKAIYAVVLRRDGRRARVYAQAEPHMIRPVTLATVIIKLLRRAWLRLILGVPLSAMA